MTDYKKLAGKEIVDLIPYKPGKPVKELERELGVESAVKLASNENPLGPSPKAIEAAAKFMPEASRYPLGDAFYLRKKMAEKLGVDGNMLLFGTGSNEIIELILRTFLTGDDHVMSYAPSFSVYGLIAQAMRKSCVWVPMKEGFEVDFQELKAKINADTRVIFLANPNNPTGTYFNTDALVDFMEAVPADTIVVMDEAYIEYADADDFPDTLELLKKYSNIVAMRTFSKAYGLAAFRVGYIVAHPECISMLDRVRQPFNVNMLGQVAAEAALDDEEFLERTISENAKGKEFLYNAFEELELEYVPTQANFILVYVGDGEKVFNELLKEGVIVRFLGTGLKHFIRVTVGTEEENKIFIEKLKKVL